MRLEHTDRQQWHRVLVDRRQMRPSGFLGHVHAQDLLVGLQAVQHTQQRALTGLPAHHGQVFVGGVVPIHKRRAVHMQAVIGEMHGEQVHHGVLRQRARVAVAHARVGRVRRVADRPQRFGGGVEAFHEQCARIGAPPETAVAVHLLGRGEFRQASAHRGAVLFGHGEHGVRAAGRGLGHHDRRAGRIRHARAVRADARIEDRRGVLPLAVIVERELQPARFGGDAVLAELADKQLAVDREQYRAARVVDAVRDDAAAAFTRALAAGALLGRHILGVGVGEQRARVGEHELAHRVGAVVHADPQRRHRVLTAVGTQEQHAFAVTEQRGTTRGAAGEPGCARLVGGVFAHGFGLDGISRLAGGGLQWFRHTALR